MDGNVPVTAEGAPPVCSETLPFSRIPHSTKIFRDFLARSGAAPRFYPRAPLTLDWLREEAGRIRYDDARRERVAAVLARQNEAWHCGEATRENLRRFRAGAVTVVTGQQVGLFGGPLFAILKAISAIKIAQEATRTGVDAVPVFWLATEDHDFDEVNRAVLPAADASLRTFSTMAQHADAAPVADVWLGPEMADVLEQVAQVLPQSDALDALRSAYRPGARYGDAFAELFTAVFREFGIILLDPYDRELHEIAAPVLRSALERSDELAKALMARGRELHEAGYHEQVKVTAGSTLVFKLDEGRREPIRGNAHDGYIYDRHHNAPAELLEQVTAHPLEFSPNVLLRPVVQDYLLPTLAYVGGPAEVAYFAQAAVVYEKLAGRVTPVLPRFSATIVEPPIQRLLDKYGVSIIDVFCGSDDLKRLLGSRVLPKNVDIAFSEVERAVRVRMEDVREELAELDPTLNRAAEKAAAKMRYQLGRLRRRAANAELRRNADLARHAERLTSALYPHKAPQERTIAGVAFVAHYGTEVLNTLLAAANLGGEHVIVRL